MSRYPELSEQERFPLLTPAGRELLYRVRQHPRAPVWNWPNGEQLDEQGLERVKRFAEELAGREHLSPTAGACPAWLGSFCDFCLETVPFYRGRTAAGTPFESVPSFRRHDLAPRVWDLVPDTADLGELIVFSTSGTTGHPMRVPTHPWTAACGVPLIEAALARFGLQFPRGPDSVGLTNIVSYRDAFTTAIVISYLQESGCVRVNLHPSAWRKDGDREAYLNEWRSPIWLGDPLAFEDLQRIELVEPPGAIVSSILRMSPALHEQLARTYDCPVLDLYALTEAGIVALGTPDGHEILPHDLFVEILDENDQPCAAEQPGEIVISSARNPYLPLLRYRTGDFASLKTGCDGRQLLVDFEGRAPVRFVLRSNRLLHSMEVTRLMREFPLIRYRLYQQADGGFEFAFYGHVDQRLLKEQLFELLEQPAQFSFRELDPTQAVADQTVFRSCVAAR